MNDAFAAALTNAHTLIEAGRGAEAEALLRPLLAEHANDPDVWWVYAYAVEDVAEAKAALYNVLRLDPTYPGAQDLLDQLEAQQLMAEPEAATPMPGIRPLPPRPAAPTPSAALPTVPGAATPVTRDAPVPDFEDDDTPAREPARAGWLLPVAAAVIVALLLGGLVWAFTRDGGPAVTPTAPAVALEATSVPPTAVADVTIEPTAVLLDAVDATDDALALTEAAAATMDAPPVQMLPAVVTALPLAVLTQEAQATAVEDQLAAQVASALTLAQPAVRTADTPLGNTLVVAVCATRATLRLDTEQAFTQLAQAAQGADVSAYDALGVQLVDCDAAQVLRTLAAPAAQVQQGALADILARVQPVTVP